MDEAERIKLSRHKTLRGSSSRFVRANYEWLITGVYG